MGILNTMTGSVNAMKTGRFFKWLAWVTVALLAFGAGWWLSPGGGEADDEVADEPAGETRWTCSMHPQVNEPGPGSCPICGMDLIPLEEDDDEDERDLPRLRLSERALSLMNIQVAPVRRTEATAEILMAGRIDYDETQFAEVTAYFRGRVDRLFADFTGMRVDAGEHLVEMYSPQLFSAQEELILALRGEEDLQERGTAGAKREAQAMVGSAREQLRLLGLVDRQIDEIVERGTPATHTTFFSPIGGTVLERHVSEGEYVETGDLLLTVADLSHLWVKLEAYESDLPLLRFGQKVSFQVAALPGETFEGVVAYIDPVVDPLTRTVRARVNLPNPDGRLKPGMFVRGMAKAPVTHRGEAVPLDLRGKWISPMHPEIVKDEAGECDICGMELVPAEKLGFIPMPETNGEAGHPLLIPETAPLLTGKRALVYIRLPDTERPTFEARQVELGPRVSGHYVVLDGLEEGDRVVVNGNFKIDSELQIRGRPSMMAPEGEDPEGEPDPAEEAVDYREAPERSDFAGDVPESFGRELRPLVRAYLDLTAALADDDEDTARESLAEWHAVLLEIGEHRLDGDAHMTWMERYEALHVLSHRIDEAEGIEGIRERLQELTREVEKVAIDFGAGELPTLYRLYCPMAYDDQGATWLQDHDTVDNAYFGASMLRCGEVLGEL